MNNRSRSLNIDEEIDMDKKKREFMGYMMTDRQIAEVKEILRDDILERYDNEEYWNFDIINQFASDVNHFDSDEKIEGKGCHR